MADASLRIGCVKYLNALPLIHGWPGPVVFDHPAALCRRLGTGELDVAFSSSFEVLRQPEYSIADDICVSSTGPVYSVFVALAQNWSAVRHLEIDPASQTSVNLLHCLLREQGICEPPPAQLRDPLSPLGPRHARLLIGDQALRFREKFRERYRYWDLGEHWQRTMALPFVYAVWLIRPEVKGAAGIAAKLRARRDANLAQLDRVIAAQTDFAPDFCEYYFRSCLRFACDRRAKDGLQAFGELCQKHNILPQKERTLRFV